MRKLPPGEGYTTLEMADPFEAYHKELTQSDRESKTIERYSQVTTSYKNWLGNRPPDTASAKEFLAHLRGKGYAPKSILLYYHALKLFLEYIGQPLKLKLRKPRVLPPYHDCGDIEALIAQAQKGLYHQTEEQKTRNTAMILAFAYTGIRRGELRGLLVGDVDFNRRTILVHGKGAKDRVIPMAARIITPLREQCARKLAQDKVFPGLNDASVWRIVTRLARACGLESFHPHSLRHYFATQLVERGANLRDIQALLGHESLEVTSIYLDVSARHLRETVELLDSVPPFLFLQSTHSPTSGGGFPH
jgi:integrase